MDRVGISSLDKFPNGKGSGMTTTPYMRTTTYLGFYVTVRNGSRHAYLMGPYQELGTALAHIEAARTRAIDLDQWAHFYDFGTASVKVNDVEKFPHAKFGRPDPDCICRYPFGPCAVCESHGID